MSNETLITIANGTTTFLNDGYSISEPVRKFLWAILIVTVVVVSVWVIGGHHRDRLNAFSSEFHPSPIDTSGTAHNGVVDSSQPTKSCDLEVLSPNTPDAVITTATFTSREREH